ncbi:hypothetical protein ASE41_21385 [Streptomyces sp. Root264]|nr:hypothetical protein ASE41_21385 [Streptomyces sp. Root264]
MSTTLPVKSVAPLSPLADADGVVLGVDDALDDGDRLCEGVVDVLGEDELDPELPDPAVTVMVAAGWTASVGAHRVSVDSALTT